MSSTYSSSIFTNTPKRPLLPPPPPPPSQPLQNSTKPQTSLHPKRKKRRHRPHQQQHPKSTKSNHSHYYNESALDWSNRCQALSLEYNHRHHHHNHNNHKNWITKNYARYATSFFFNMENQKKHLETERNKYGKKKRAWRKIQKERLSLGMQQQQLEEEEEMVDLEEILVNSVPNGCGISFLDSLFSSSTNQKQARDEKEAESKKLNNNPVVEISGPNGTAKTSLLLTLAANYVVATSFSYFDTSMEKEEEDNLDNKNYNGGALQTALPNVVILDSQHDIHTGQLASAVRAAVIRRWNETSFVRSVFLSRRQQQQQQQHKQKNGTLHQNDDDEEMEKEEEWKQIELEIIKSLGRIHIVQPRDYATGFIPTLECLRYSLDKAAEQQQQQQQEQKVKGSTPRNTPSSSSSPILLLIDSLSSFDNIDRMHEALPTTISHTNNHGQKSGLSGKNEFYRQLSRLQQSSSSSSSCHQVIIVGTKVKQSNQHYDSFSPQPYGTVGVGGGNNNNNNNSPRKKNDGWSKMVTHSLTLENVVKGTKEDLDGYDFVALVPSSSSSSGESGSSRSGSVVPFLVTSSGIVC